MSKEEKTEVIHHFDAWSAHYEQEVWVRDKYFHTLVKKQVHRAIQNTNAQNIMELGVGTGVYLAEFVQNGYHVTGADISIEMLRITKEKLRQNRYNVFNLIRCDMEFLPFRKGVFNIVNCIEVLRHLPQPYKTIWKVLREKKRVLTKQGSILITVPNILFPLNLFSIIYYTIPRNIMRRLNKKIGYQYNQNASFPHFPVLYNEPEDHMYNLLFMRRLIRCLNLKLSKWYGIFFFPACPRFLSSILRRIDSILGTSIWRFLAYSYFLKLNRL
ncbi:MAG: class I SAM-dependent methyltransferase [Candidatus Helarchaeota archaeon]